MQPAIPPPTTTNSRTRDNEGGLDIGFLVYPRLTPLDLVGPWEVLSRVSDASVHLAWTRPDTVATRMAGAPGSGARHARARAA